MCSIIKLLIFPDSFQYVIAITGSKELDFGKRQQIMDKKTIANMRNIVNMFQSFPNNI